MSVIINSGYFDPIHAGHIEYFKLSKDMGEKLIVIVNNDKQAFLKKGYSFMSENDRVKIIESIKYVDEVVLSIDEDGSVSKTIRFIKERYNYDNVIFAKGGDRYVYEIPEIEICKELGIKIIDGVGKKIGNSSEFITRMQNFFRSGVDGNITL